MRDGTGGGGRDPRSPGIMDLRRWRWTDGVGRAGKDGGIKSGVYPRRKNSGEIDRLEFR